MDLLHLLECLKPATYCQYGALKILGINTMRLPDPGELEDHPRSLRGVEFCWHDPFVGKMMLGCRNVVRHQPTRPQMICKDNKSSERSTAEYVRCIGSVCNAIWNTLDVLDAEGHDGVFQPERPDLDVTIVIPVSYFDHGEEDESILLAGYGKHGLETLADQHPNDSFARGIHRVGRRLEFLEAFNTAIDTESELTDELLLTRKEVVETVQLSVDAITAAGRIAIQGWIAADPMYLQDGDHVELRGYMSGDVCLACGAGAECWALGEGPCNRLAYEALKGPRENRNILKQGPLPAKQGDDE